MFFGRVTLSFEAGIPGPRTLVLRECEAALGPVPLLGDCDRADGGIDALGGVGVAEAGGPLDQAETARG